MKRFHVQFVTLVLSQVGPIEGPMPKPRSGHRIVYHKGKIYSFGGFNPAVDGADPDLEGDEYWQDSKPLFKVSTQNHIYRSRTYIYRSCGN